MKIGMICPSEIATRRFLPALRHAGGMHFSGVAAYTARERFGGMPPDAQTVKEALRANKEKAQNIINQYGGKLFESYHAIAVSDEIDALYIPLPPALHYQWAKAALEHGKHVMVEKPATTSYQETCELIELARRKNLALHENYMFCFHRQLDELEAIIQGGEIGDVRLYRIAFGFPMREPDDFRYKKSLGGGALLDAGGYTLKYASRILGETAQIRYAQMNGMEGFEVDMYGSGALSNDSGTTVQVSFGMDNAYKCELEAWGSKGTLTAHRVLTAPAGFVPSVSIIKGQETEERTLSADDAFRKSILHFARCIEDGEAREQGYEAIRRQAGLVEKFYECAQKNRTHV